MNKKELEELKFENNSLRTSLDYKTKECDKLLTDIIISGVRVRELENEIKHLKQMILIYKSRR